MKPKTNKLSLNFMFASSPLVAGIPASVVTGDTDRPIHIELDQQSFDMQGNAIAFTGNVIATQGTIKINADKVVVIRPGGEQGREVIDGYGKPVTSYQIQDNGKPVEGYVLQMHYELAKDLVVLTGNAYPQQVDSNVKGDRITHLMKEQEMQTSSDKDKRATTVLVPSQLQDGNNKGQTPAQKKGN